MTTAWPARSTTRRAISYVPSRPPGSSRPSLRGSCLRLLTLPPAHAATSLASQWVIIDSVVYDLSKFAKFHPGGLAALMDESVAGQDATDVFYGLHRAEVLEKPAYARLRIGTIKGQSRTIFPREKGALKQVPYSEPVRPDRSVMAG